MMIRFLVIVASMLFVGLSHGEEVPMPGSHDARIREVTYNPSEVFRINAHYGYTLLIQLDPAENIEDGAVAMGDPGAWKAVPVRNNLFLKPTAKDATTNLTVVTNKRTYSFDVKAVKGNQDAQMYVVRFSYPQEDNQRQLAANMRRKVTSLMEKKAAIINWNYWAKGSNDLQPIMAGDNGRFTYLTFSGGQDMPAIYEETENGEALVNTHVEGNTIVVHKVSKKLILRKGAWVTCVFNRDFNPNTPMNSSRTAVPGVKRVIKK